MTIPNLTHEHRTYRYEFIHPDALTMGDLAAIVATKPKNAPMTAYRLTIYSASGHQLAERAEALLIDGNRLGIAWGGDATWGDILPADNGEVLNAFYDWLNDAEAWEARN